MSEFRARLITGDAGMRLLETELSAFTERGLLKARGRQRTESTRVIEAVRDLNRLELVGETVRQTLNPLAQTEPAWLKQIVPTEWYRRYRRRLDQMHLPKARADRDQPGQQIGADGLRLLQAVKASTAPAGLKDLTSVRLLRQVWEQQFHVQKQADLVRARRSGAVPPASVLIISPFDPETRYCLQDE